MDQFIVLQTLGKGSFGVVRKVKRKSDGKTLVVKEMDYGSADEKQRQQIVAEVSSLDGHAPSLPVTSTHELANDRWLLFATHYAQGSIAWSFFSLCVLASTICRSCCMQRPQLSNLCEPSK